MFFDITGKVVPKLSDITIKLVDFTALGTTIIKDNFQVITNPGNVNYTG
jgi:hypothetical protein